MDEPIIRRRISLDGTWEFGTDPTASLTPEQASTGRTIEVPGAWQAQHADLERYDGVAWYCRSIDVGPRESGMALESAILHLGAVDYRCDVWINGQPAGGHVGGYTPVELEVGHLLAAGANTISVRVEDYAYKGIETDRWPDPVHRSLAADLPHGKQSWYLEISGIWGRAWLDLAADPNIASVHVTPDIRASSACVRVAVRGAGGSGAIDASEATRVSVSIAPPGADPVASREVPLTGAEVTLDLPIPQARLWEPDDPFLYEAVATITRDGEPIDGLRTRFGMREIRAEGGRLWLNGRPLYLRAALDQDFYPETIYTPPSDDYLRNQFVLAKEMGLNCLRAHIKPVDPRYLDLCDEIGLLVWAELPSWRTLWPKERLDSRVSVPLELQQEVERTFDELVARDFNHPSIIIWTLVNEDWGTQLIFSESDRAWLGRFYERAKRIDPTRLVVDNSPCFSGHGPNFHVQSDLDDFHVYAAMPERYRNFQRWVEDFSLRPTWTYSTFGDAQRRGDEPLLVSEFGTWGLPTLSAMRKHWHDGAPPGWWATGHWWGSGEMSYPVGAEERFATSGLEAIWRDYDEFAEATQQHEGRALKAQIELIRSQPTIQGYVITEFTDIYWEANGLLDFYRQPKAFHDSLMAYNGPDVLIPKWERTSYWGGETLRVPITLSHWSGAATGQCRLRWAIPSLGLEGDRPIEGPEVGMTVPLGAISAGLPNPGTSRAIRVDIWLEHADGQIITRSFHDFMLVSRASGDPRREMTVLVNDPRYLDMHGASSASFELASPAELESEGESSPTDSDDLWVDSDPEGGVIRRRSRSGQSAAQGLSNTLSRLGYRVTDSLDQAELVVATKLDRRLLDRLKAGGRLLFLPLETSPFFHVSGRGSGRDGNWISAFHWLRPDLPLSVPVENPLDFAFTDVLPERVILGHGGRMSRDVLAGLVTGWVHLPTATICQFRYGRGTVVMCTWKLRGYAGSDPVATALLHDLVAYAASDSCNPETTL